MSCPYSEEQLAYWNSVCNPMGPACYECDECECAHWAADHSEYCPHLNPDCIDSYYRWEEEDGE